MPVKLLVFVAKPSRMLLAISCLAVALVGTGHLRAAGAVQAPAAEPAVEYRAVLDKYCVTCHNQKLRSGALALDGLNLSAVAANAETWEKVLRKLASGAMPPAGRPRPEPATGSALVSWLTGELDRAAAAQPNPGRTEPFHRLNRAEYQNAIRDLLALDVDVTGLLPADQTTRGFDNIAEGLSISPALLDQYLSTARKLSWQALGLPPVAAVVETQQVPPGLDQDEYIGDMLPGSRGGYAFRYYFPVDGEYLLQIELRRQNYDYIVGLGEAHQIDARIDGARIGQFAIGGPHGHPPPLSFLGNHTGDEAWETYNLRMDDGLRIRFKATAGAHRISVAFAERLMVAEGVMQPSQTGGRNAARLRDDVELQNPSINAVSIAGPYNSTGPGDTPSRRRVLVCRPRTVADEGPCARRIISTLARRAFRGSVGENDLQALLHVYDQGRRGADFDAGIQFALEGILAHPRFLFRIERDPAQLAPGSPYRLSDIELASRLSFFLWSSIPDDQLLTAADRGILRAPGALGKQARRLLSDPRSSALLDNFIGQWLELRNLKERTPDARLFPVFTDNLREAFRRETQLFVESQVREDRSALDLLSANYTFVNEALARFYGIPGVYGDYFRRVSLDASSPRVGLLSQGSVLTVTSYPNRTSPVLRGKWLLENVLGAPPPPPPPDVPALKDRGENGRPASVRERLEQHRKNPVCATCHAQMDPLGFSLENFDAIGAWRTTDQGSPVDASAVTADGTELRGPAGLRQFLLGHPDRFVETLTEKLLAYALGRTLHHYDMPAVRAIVREARATNYRWSSLVTGIVNSQPFHMRRTRDTDGRLSARNAGR